VPETSSFTKMWMMRAAGSTFFFLWLLVYYMLGSIGKAFAERNKVTAVSCEFDTVQVDCAAGVSPVQSGCWRYRVFGCKGSTALMGVLWVCAFHWERTCFQECLFRELCLHLSQWFFLACVRSSLWAYLPLDVWLQQTNQKLSFFLANYTGSSRTRVNLIP
jgi:hypothetical protein